MSETQQISPEQQTELDYLGGKQAVVEYCYADGTGTRFLLESLDGESDAVALWQDLAFTNGPPLVEVKIRWDPEAAQTLREHLATPAAPAEQGRVEMSE